MDDEKALVPVGESERQALVALDDPYHPSLPPLRHPKEVIERCLYELAFQGGNARKAHVVLERQGINVSAEQMYRWIRGRFRNRYQQLVSQEVGELREQIARDATDLALEVAEAERRALEQTLASLASANAVEASMILRNLTASKQMNIDNEGKLRGRAGTIIEVRGLDQILGDLEKLGVAEAIPDAEVVAD